MCVSTYAENNTVKQMSKAKTVTQGLTADVEGARVLESQLGQLDVGGLTDEEGPVILPPGYQTQHRHRHVAALHSL